MTSEIYVFGNPDIKEDSLPIKILPQLKAKFPKIRFEIKDPNEEWDIPENLVIIDTVIGIDKVTVFQNLDNFSRSPRVSMHDFDVYTNIRMLQKLGKLKKITIIGVPIRISETQILDMIVEEIKKTL